MNGPEAKQFVLERVKVDRANIVDAKGYLAAQVGHLRERNCVKSS